MQRWRYSPARKSSCTVMLKKDEFWPATQHTEQCQGNRTSLQRCVCEGRPASKPLQGILHREFRQEGQTCQPLDMHREWWQDCLLWRMPPRFTRLAQYWRGKKNVVRNTKKLQHDYSTICGQWCMYFVWRRCCGWMLKNIISPFRKGTPLINDYVMNHLIKTKFGTDKKVIDRPFLKQQICKAMEQNIAEWKLSTTAPHKQTKG